MTNLGSLVLSTAISAASEFPSIFAATILVPSSTSSSCSNSSGVDPLFKSCTPPSSCSRVRRGMRSWGVRCRSASAADSFSPSSLLSRPRRIW
uniref:Putative secreted protein n=1 Tax=Ixodes ricinus TaxID=34613 RepID=A0A6B0UBV2_IXORI